MLDKAGVNGHLGFVGVNLLYLVGDTGPKADTVCRQGIGILREIKLERRITYHKVKLLEASILFYMGGFQKGVPLHHIRQAAHQIVQNQIQSQHFAGLVRNILAVNGAAVLAHLVRKRHKERAGTSTGVVTGCALVFGFGIHQKLSHHLGNCSGSKVFRILTATGIVVILNQVFKNAAEKVILFVKNFFKVKFRDVLYQRLGKIIALTNVGHIGRNGSKDVHFRLARGHHRKLVLVIGRDINQSGI